MGWFEEQIAQRKLADQKTMADSLLNIASAVLGNEQAGRLNNKQIYTKEAIDEILKYYHCKPADIPDEITDVDEQLEYCLRPHGIMCRSIRLQQEWYRDAMGPMMAFLKDSDTPVALLPGRFYGYSYWDAESGEKIGINRETAGRLREEAICFYRPLPLRKIDVSDLIIYLKDCLDPGDYLLLFILFFLLYDFMGAGIDLQKVFLQPRKILFIFIVFILPSR